MNRVECEVGLPFDGNALLAYWRVRCVPGMESIEGGVYRRSLRRGREVGELCVDLGAGEATGTVPAGTSSNLGFEAAEVVALVRNLVDADAPLSRIASALGGDPVLGPLVAERPGLRIPGTVDPFELTVRAIVGQQVSVAAAATFTARIAEECGERAGQTALPLVFPEPSRMVDAPLEERCGVSGRRAGAIRSVAAKVLSGDLDLRPNRVTAAELESVSGVGPWTASYIALRGLRERDAIPLADTGLRAAAGSASAAELAARAERWRPFRAYAAAHLWTTYLT